MPDAERNPHAGRRFTDDDDDDAIAYQLIRQPKPTTERQFDIEFLDAGVEALAFTFG
jgi:hypothetical protein